MAAGTQVRSTLLKSIRLSAHIQAASARGDGGAGCSGRSRRGESADLLQIALQRRKRLLGALKISGLQILRQRAECLINRIRLLRGRRGRGGRRGILRIFHMMVVMVMAARLLRILLSALHILLRGLLDVRQILLGRLQNLR